MKAFKQFMGPPHRAKYAYTDNSKELRKACDALSIDHDRCTPHRPQTNGIAESSVKRVKEGTACQLVQSGWNDEWWAHACRCFCFYRNVVDILAPEYGRPEETVQDDALAVKE